MKRIDHRVDLAIGHEEAFHAWTDFAQFPAFMGAVTRVTVTDALHSVWELRVAGLDWEYDALITANDPGRMLEWITTSGEVSLAGRAVFDPLTETSSRLLMRIEWTPRGPLEHLASMFGGDSLIVRRELSAFRAHVEVAVRDGLPHPLR
ncbi:SRPBCC family protein [Subtercola boreus]|uniref:SRPBCC family protein n=1 Tax=Subtercola boreus TaxID=120213 RepID=UPI0015591995|nr:SRPBCC family protein [Subtercola boreus]